MNAIKLIALTLLELFVVSFVLGVHSISNQVKNRIIHDKIKRKGYSNHFE